jgi:hypothetical protein
MSIRLSLRIALQGLLAASLAMSLAACVSTRVSSTVIGTQHATIDRVIVFPQPGNFSSGNAAGNLGQRNLDRLAPSLQARLPADLSANGLQARWWVDGAVPAPGEAVLTLAPVSAAWNSRTGQTLVMRATLLSALQGRPIWTADITMKTLTFANWGDGLADDIATQLVERLRADHLLLGSGAIKVAASL